MPYAIKRQRMKTKSIKDFVDETPLFTRLDKVRIVEKIPLVELKISLGLGEEEHRKQIIFVVELYGYNCQYYEKVFFSYEDATRYVKMLFITKYKVGNVAGLL